MAKSRQEKEKIVEKLKDVFNSAKSIVFVNFHGLSVDDANEMRRKLRAEDIGYFVAKKTLTGIALKDAPFEGEVPDLEGELAIAYGDEPTAAARNIYDFQKKFDEAVRIMGGVFENNYLDKEEMTEIAQIPDMKTLRGMFVNVINSPIQGLAIVLSQAAEQRS